ncbi:MAG: tRNA pseudouridine(38-40) synthase TruA [Phycisphaeraceae bacterium]|nr:tRNA pseudouridine(38-40) synthase TruA [Phycisphaeraceae bacterium]
MPRFRLHIAYEGTDFHGWQRQDPASGEAPRTVQAVVEAALAEALGVMVPLKGASRTDAGVHALDQIAAFTAETRIPVERLAQAITSRLPDDVQVRTAFRVPEDFDPSVHCASKGYRYRIRHGLDSGEPPPLFDRRMIWHTWHRLDVDAMRHAAPLFEGEHDFLAMTRVDHGRAHTVRRVHLCRVRVRGDHDLEIDVAGPGFLYNMVRIIAGTLVEVGRGRLAPSSIREILESRDRSRAGPTLPPHGLRLEWIHLAPWWTLES